MKIVLAFAALFFVGVTERALAGVSAVLVGVTEYQDDAIPDLRGPLNDVQLMRDVLTRRGVKEIVILSSGLDGATTPTRTAILQALDDRVNSVGSGDLVYIHLSGHGSRQPDKGTDETDGLDEIFLPMDAGTAPSGSNQVPNAITDDEIGEKIAAIRENGADVVLVMDSCYSGSGMRAIAPRLVERQVDAAALGIDLSGTAQRKPAVDTVVDPAVATAGAAGSMPGGYLAFYATRSNDVAREADLSQGEGSDGSHWYGLFTAALAARLEGEQALTYRQLFQSALVELNKGAGFGMGAVQTPIWEGNMIDSPVFGGGHAAGPVRYLLEGNRLDAGQVHGLKKGALMALVADVADAPDAVLGYAQVVAAEPRSATLRPVDADCRPVSTALCPFAKVPQEKAGFAQLELGPIDQLIRFSPVLASASGTPLPWDHALQARLATALDTASARIGIAAKTGGDAYAVQVLLQDDTLWFGPAAQIGQAPVGLSFDLSGDDEQLTGLLMRILRAERLMGTLDGLAGSSSFVNPSPVTVTASRFASDIESLAAPGTPVDPQSECRAALLGMNEASFQDLALVSDLKQCDLLRFAAIGNRDGLRDVNRIHVDAQYCVHVDYELIEGSNAPRPLGDPMIMCSDCPGPIPYSAGHERLYVLVSEARENAEALNLSGLVENCGTGSGAQSTRSAARLALAGLLEDAAARGTTRGSMGLGSALSDVWAESYRWRIVPRETLFAIHRN